MIFIKQMSQNSKDYKKITTNSLQEIKNNGDKRNTKAYVEYLRSFFKKNILD